MNIRLNALMILFIFPYMINARTTEEMIRVPAFREKHPEKCSNYKQKQEILHNNSTYQASQKADSEADSFKFAYIGGDRHTKQVISRHQALIYWTKGKLPWKNFSEGKLSLQDFKQNCINSVKESYIFDESYLYCDTPECEFAREMDKKFQIQKDLAIKKAEILRAKKYALQEWKDYIEADQEINRTYFEDEKFYEES